MTPGLERILVELNKLSAAERSELRDLLEREQASFSSRSNWAGVMEVKGKYSFVPTSSEAFALRKAVEIDIENGSNNGQ